MGEGAGGYATGPAPPCTWGVVDVSRDLMSLGMSLALDRSLADLSRIHGSQRPGVNGYLVGPVFHKAFVEVNEKGTEAAAATAVGMPSRES